MSFSSQDYQERRRLEEILRSCGDERDWLNYKDAINRGKVRALVADARAVGITVRDISRMTGVSTQTLHIWLRAHMRPVPLAHYGLHGPPSASVEETVLRVIAEDPSKDWTALEVVSKALPAGWPTVSTDQAAAAMDLLARTHCIWDGENGTYRLAPPAEIAGR